MSDEPWLFRHMFKIVSGIFLVVALLIVVQIVAAGWIAYQVASDPGGVARAGGALIGNVISGIERGREQ